MDFSKLTDKLSDLAEQGGNLIEDAATSVKDKVTDVATAAMGKAADKLSGDRPSADTPSGE